MTASGAVTTASGQSSIQKELEFIMVSKKINGNRSYIAAQNLMEGDEFVMRNEANIFVEKIRRNEDKATVGVTFSNGMKRKYTWGDKALIIETPARHSYRRNSLRRNEYPNYLEVLEEQFLFA
jgi:hypothetical protein